MPDHPLLYNDEGHVPHELEQLVKEAIQRYPNMDAEWWLGPVAAIRAVNDWLLDALTDPNNLTVEENR